MSVKVEGDRISVGFGEGSIFLTVAEAQRLAKLKDTEGWPILKQLLAAINDGCTFMLRDRSKGIEDLRYVQGQTSVSGFLADLIEEEIPAWYTEHNAKEKADEPS